MTAQMSFEDIAEWAASLPDDDRVHVDPVRGHIRLGDVIFADLGSCLHLWAYSGHHLTPAAARGLGDALRAWGERKSARSPWNDAMSDSPTPSTALASGDLEAPDD